MPQALLERPTGLQQGIGRAHDEVTSRSTDAKAFYDQGLAYLHSYVWIEAARSFHQALRLDPSLAIAHVGLSFAYIELNKPADAQRALDRARDLSAAASGHDRRHIELRTLQMASEANPRDAGKRLAYRAALDGAVAEFPSDAELWLLKGLAESPDPAERGQGAVAASIPSFERALKLSPAHFGAFHYLTHASENTGRIKDAVTNGQQYARLAPRVPHARHMLGHDLRRVGRVDDAIVEFEAADQLSRDYFQRENVPAEFDWHYHHNLDLLGTSYAYRGEMKKAAGLLQRAFALPTNLVGQAVNKREWPQFLLARGRVEDSLAAARTLVAHPHPVVQTIGHIEAGYALLATGQYAATSTEANAALRLLRAGAEGGGLATSAFEGLQGELFLRTGQREKGRQFLLQAAAKWRAAPGPDAWSEALFRLEAMARVARDVGDWEFADVVSRQMLDHDDAYAGSHYAAALVAEQSGDAAGARAAFARAIKGWSHADADLPELAVARRNR